MPARPTSSWPAWLLLPFVVASIVDDDYAPSWAPDGETLLFSSWRAEISRLYTIRLDQTGTGTPFPTHEFHSFSPAWSPDGQRIAFTSLRDEVPGQPGLRRLALYVARADGSNVQRLAASVSSPIHDPAWSPDGTRIVFGATGQGSLEDLFVVTVATDAVVTVATDAVEQLTQTPQAESQPHWSPDGERIVFV